MFNKQPDNGIVMCSNHFKSSARIFQKIIDQEFGEQVQSAHAHALLSAFLGVGEQRLKLFCYAGLIAT